MNMMAGVAIRARACVGVIKHRGTTLPPYFTQRCMRSLHTTPPRPSDPPPNNMKIWYVPNPFKWLYNRLEMATLTREWDPGFVENDFKLGARQAVCTVSELVNKREWGEMRGLLTQDAITNLRGTKWTEDQGHNLVLGADNVQIVQINNVRLQTVVDNRYCDIDVSVIGTRAPYNPHKHGLIVLEYMARFHREYTVGKLPEWTITKFALQNFQAIKRA